MGKKNKLNLDNKFSVFVKLSRRIPNSVNIVDAVRELLSSSPVVRKPRQKSSRWFLVDFETNEQAEEFKKLLIGRKEIAGIKIKVNKLAIKSSDSMNKPENGRQNYVNTLTKQTFQSKTLDKYSSKLLVTNLPENVDKIKLMELFPNSMIDLKSSPKLRALITYTSAKEAMSARMSVRPIIDGQKIRVILLLEDTTRKSKAEPENMKEEEDVGNTKDKKKDVKQPYKLVKPLRYFETEIE